MDRTLLVSILARIPDLRIIVLGDYFLDSYLILDPSLSERSIETRLEARQVVEVRRSAGAAGTVTNNLSALGVGAIEAMGVIGLDGEGEDLLRCLARTRVTTEGLLRSDDIFTPTYIKPMLKTATGERELERIDIKNRKPLQHVFEAKLLDMLHQKLSNESVHAVILADQVQERYT